MRRSSHRLGTASTRRLPAALLLLLLVLAQWSSLAHLLLVPHVLCLEHGEFVEASAPAETERGAAAQAEKSQVSSSESAVSRGSSLAATPEHEHCFVAAQYRRWVPLPESELPGWALPLASVGEVAGVPVDVRSSSIALLHLAPKTSPPRLRFRQSGALKA